MQHGVHGVHLACAAKAVVVATEFLLESASRLSVEERNIVKESLRDTYHVTQIAVAVSYTNFII